MKKLTRTKSILFCGLFLIGFANGVQGSECLNYLTVKNKNVFGVLNPSIPLENSWSESNPVRQTSKKSVNGLLLQIVSDYFVRNKHVPNEKELIGELLKRFPEPTDYIKEIVDNGLDAYFAKPGTPVSIANIFLKSLEYRRQIFYPYKVRLRKEIMTYFALNFRTPTVAEIAKIMATDEYVIMAMVSNPQKFIAEAILENPEVIKEMQAVLAKTYLRTINQKDTPKNMRTQTVSPNLASIFQTFPNSLVRKYDALKYLIENGNYRIEDFLTLFASEQNSSSFFPTIPIFNDLKNLENMARKISPNSFENFIPAEIYNPENVERLNQAFEIKNGFLVVSVTSGVPLDELMFATMLKYAEARDFDIIVIPVMKIMDGLDPRLLNHPRIHVLTHTRANPFLKISNMGIHARQIKPDTSLDSSGMHSPGQTIIYGHPQQVHRHIPTRTNNEAPTSIWTTGSLSQNIQLTRLPIQDRPAAIAKGLHRNGFLVLEKADAKAGFGGRGVENAWHPRDVEFVNDMNIEGFERAGFSDKGVGYYIHKDAEKMSYSSNDVVVTDKQIRTLTLGDLHEYFTDQNFLKHIVQLLKDQPNLEEIIIHDPIDGTSTNRHEADRIKTLRKRFKSGELDYHREMMRFVQFVNAIHHHRPDLKITIVDSNHSYWARNLVDNGYDNILQNVINGTFLNEIRYQGAEVYEAYDPLTYILKYRNLHIASLHEGKRQEKIEKEQIVLVSKPELIQVLTVQQYLTGPKHREDHKENHGHEGASGAKGSVRAHAVGTESQTGGDNHQTIKSGRYTSAGTSTYLDLEYNSKGYKAWANAMVAESLDGSKQILIYYNKLRSLFQRPENGVFSAEDFFGEHPMQVIVNDNDLVSSEDGEFGFVDQFSAAPKPQNRERSN